MSDVVLAVGGARPYAVHVGPGLLARLGPLLRAEGLSGRLALVSDTNVLTRWLSRPLASLRESGYDVVPVAIAPGEANKTLASAERVFHHLAEAGLGREDAIVALGGGVVGDLAGFVAATWQRGVPFVQLPTTLLAQCDASIGGKVAVDLPSGKNLVGAFHAPRLVVADVDTLATLPRRERWNGLAEVVKAALVSDAKLLHRLSPRIEALGEGSVGADELTALLADAIGVKAGLVTADERDERGVRAILNFGHTVGHALEAATGFSALLHGEAVVLGMRAAIALSVRLGRLRPEDAAGALAPLVKFPAPPPFSRPAREQLRVAARLDKKHGAGALRFVVLDSIGRASLVPVTEADLGFALDAALEAIP